MNAKIIFSFLFLLSCTFQIEAQDSNFIKDSDVFFAGNNTISLEQKGLESLLEKLSSPKISMNGTIRVLEYKVDSKDLPKYYRDLAKQTFYSPQEDGTYREGKILEFIYRKELNDREYNRKNTTDEAIIQLVNNDAGTIGELIARLDYCNEYVALKPDLVKLTVVKELPHEVKNKFVSSEYYLELQRRFTDYQEETNYSLGDKKLNDYISYQGNVSPTGTMIHIISLSIGNPCGDDFYEQYRMFLTENHGHQNTQIKVRQILWEEDEAIYDFFQNSKTGTIYYYSQSNTELKINSLTPSGDTKIEAIRRLHFYTCGC